jgi:hypothetical protein
LFYVSAQSPPGSDRVDSSICPRKVRLFVDHLVESFAAAPAE